jgi:hypothetical protein
VLYNPLAPQVATLTRLRERFGITGARFLTGSRLAAVRRAAGIGAPP